LSPLMKDGVIARWSARRGMSDGWSRRVGEPAAAVIRRAATWRKVGGAAGLLFLVAEIGFEVDHFYRPGIEASSVLLGVAMYGLFFAIRLMAKARRLVADRLGLPADEARWVRLRHGEAGFDRWLARRDQPEWSRGQ
jgi:hypothetical protein